MRKLARYTFEASAQDLPNAHAVWLARCRSVETWLNSKGTRGEDGTTIAYKDGRVASLDYKRVKSDVGESRIWHIEEPIPEGRFRTTGSPLEP